jgi:hypothetical protein
MPRLFASPQALIPRVLKIALAGLVVLAAVVTASTPAYAAPMQRGTSSAVLVGHDVASPEPSNAKTGFTMLNKAPAPFTSGKAVRMPDRAGTNAVFTCSYFAYYPPYIIDFRCDVTAGAIQLWIDCSNGVRYFSPILPAVGTYYLRGICSPFTVTNFGANQLA